MWRCGPTVSETSESVRETRGADGYRLRYRVWDTLGTRGTALLLHGVMSHSGWLRPVAGPIAERGFRVLGADRRGAGLNEEDRGDVASVGVLFSDLEALLDAEHRGGELVVFGWCWGGVLALSSLSRLGHEVDALALLAPGLYPSERVSRNLPRSAGCATDGESAATIRSPIEESMFTNGPWLDDFIRKDELRLRYFSPRFARAMRSIGLSAALELRRLHKPLLVVIAERDVTVDNDKLLHVVGELSTPVTLARIDCHHGMQFEAPEEMSAEIASWLEGRFAR